VTHLAAHHLRQARCHAGEHLDLDVVPHPAAARQDPRERDVEDVLTGDAEADGAGAFGRHRPVHDPLVVGVGLLLGGPGGERPVVDLGVHPLHRQVGALHEPHLDARPAGLHARGGPVLQLHHRGERVRLVGLQHDAGLLVQQRGVVHHAAEHGEGEGEVLVVLHVEVDELRRARGGRLEVEGLELRDGVVHHLVEAPRVVRPGDGGHLQRDVVDVVAREQAGVGGEAAGGLAVAEDGLAEEVDVDAVAARAGVGERGGEALAGGVEDEVPDELAEHAPGRGDHDLGGGDGGRSRRLQCGGEVGREEGEVPPGEAGERAGGDVQVLGADDAVDEADGELQAVGVGEHAGEEAGGVVDRLVGGLDHPASGQFHGLVAGVDQFGARVAAVHGGPPRFDAL